MRYTLHGFATVHFEAVVEADSVAKAQRKFELDDFEIISESEAEDYVATCVVDERGTVTDLEEY